MTCILSSMFTFFPYLIPSMFIFSAPSLLVFLYVVVIEFWRKCLYSSFVKRYMLDVLSAGVGVFVDDYNCCKLSLSLSWNAFRIFLNLIFFTKSVKSFSNGTKSFTCGGHFLVFNPYFGDSSLSTSLLFVKRQKPESYIENKK